MTVQQFFAEFDVAHPLMAAAFIFVVYVNSKMIPKAYTRLSYAGVAIFAAGTLVTTPEHFQRSDASLPFLFATMLSGVLTAVTLVAGRVAAVRRQRGRSLEQSSVNAGDV